MEPRAMCGLRGQHIPPSIGRNTRRPGVIQPSELTRRIIIASSYGPRTKWRTIHGYFGPVGEKAKPFSRMRREELKLQIPCRQDPDFGVPIFSSSVSTFLLTIIMGLQEQFPAFGGRGPINFWLGIGFGVFTTIIILLRIYVRLRINKFGTAALLWTLGAYTFTVLAQVFGALAVLHGLGNHLTVLAKTGELRNFLVFTWITVFFFNIAIPLGKVAVAAFLIEMNAQSNLNIRRSLIAVAIINVIINIPQIIILWFQCRPYDALFDPLRQQQCDYRINQYYTYFVGAVAALSDFYFAILPITMLVPLKIDIKLKCGLSFLMGLGVFAGVAAILRSWAARSITSEDSPYGDGALFLWGQIEEWVVLIAMSIPPIWPLFRPMFQRVLKTTTPGSSSKRYKRDYGAKISTLASPAAENFGPPSTTTTIHAYDDKVVPPSPRHNVRFSEVGPPLEQPIDNDSLGEAVSQETEGAEKPRRTSLPPLSSLRHSRRWSRQDGWLELKDLGKHER